MYDNQVSKPNKKQLQSRNPMQATQFGITFTFTGNNYSVATGKALVIDQTTNFINCNFIMWGPTSRILIAAGGNHTFPNFYIGGCYNLWKGIEIGVFRAKAVIKLQMA